MKKNEYKQEELWQEASKQGFTYEHFTSLLPQRNPQGKKNTYVIDSSSSEEPEEDNNVNEIIELKKKKKNTKEKGDRLNIRQKAKLKQTPYHD